ncbi:MAG: AraC family transcriptional regulator [Pyrinomonadaceae bacterium]
MKLKAGQFYGKTSQTLSVGSYSFTEKSYAPALKLPEHAHELSHFCFVLAGNYKETIGGSPFERGPTALVFYPPEIVHSEEHKSNGRHFLLEIDQPGLEMIREYGARLKQTIYLTDKSDIRLAAQMYREFKERDEFSALAIESITTELLVAASRRLTGMKRGATPPVWLKRVKDCLHENYSAPPALKDLAKAADVHPTHLARVFRQYENCTTGEFVRKIRIENACRMIIAGRSFIEISLENGFADQSHFTRVFNRQIGMTPSEFRKVFRSR